MKLLDQSAKTNWKFIGIVAFVAVFLAGGILMLIPQFQEQPPPLPPSVISTPNGNGNNNQILDTSTWQTYRTDEFGFEIKYPENARLIIPTWNSISDKPSAVIIKFNFATGCIDEFMSLGIKEEDAIIECRGDVVDIAIIGEKQKTLQDFINEESSVFSKTHCNIQTQKIGTINAFELSNKTETGGCLVGDSSFYYLEIGNKIFKIGISDNTDDITNQILATFRFVE